MSSSSEIEVTSTQSQPAQIQPDPWVPQFQIQGNPVTSADSVMQNDLTALAVGRNITMPEDTPAFATMTDTALANGSLILGTRALTILSNVCNRLQERGEENASMGRLLDHFREQVYSLRAENRELKKKLKRVRKMREEIGMRLISYQDFVNTRLLEFEDEMDEVVEQGNQLLRTFHQNSHIPLPNGHKKSKSF